MSKKTIRLEYYFKGLLSKFVPRSVFENIKSKTCRIKVTIELPGEEPHRSNLSRHRQVLTYLAELFQLGQTSQHIPVQQYNVTLKGESKVCIFTALKIFLIKCFFNQPYLTDYVKCFFCIYCVCRLIRSLWAKIKVITITKMIHLIEVFCALFINNLASNI
jgi:hypothetical protein